MRYGQRRYPRLTTDHPGEMELRVRERGRAQRLRVPVSVRSLAPEGAGVSLDEGEHPPIRRGASVTLHFVADGQDFDLPGSVAWCHDSNGAAPDRPMDVGVRLHLEMAGLQTRQAYASWIVNRLNAAQQTRR